MLTPLLLPFHNFHHGSDLSESISCFSVAFLWGGGRGYFCRISAIHGYSRSYKPPPRLLCFFLLTVRLSAVHTLCCLLPTSASSFTLIFDLLCSPDWCDKLPLATHQRYSHSQSAKLHKIDWKKSQCGPSQLHVLSPPVTFFKLVFQLSQELKAGWKKGLWVHFLKYNLFKLGTFVQFYPVMECWRVKV